LTVPHIREYFYTEIRFSTHAALVVEFQLVLERDKKNSMNHRRRHRNSMASKPASAMRLEYWGRIAMRPGYPGRIADSGGRKIV
jgi:hypothetical protein